MSLVEISRVLRQDVDCVPHDERAAFTYNPLEYARAPHEMYLNEYGAGNKEVLLVGMNPGPFGMAQNGVPFGDTQMVSGWLKISGKVGKPKKEHEKRLITGFDCARSEVSGTRLWSFAKDHFQTPKKFFKRFFVANYCPLVFMEEGGRNLTPDKLTPNVRTPLFAACDKALLSTVEELRPEWVLGVGAFAQKQAVRALASLDVRIGTILHPSPASPRANRGWAAEVSKQFEEMGIHVPQAK